MQYRHIARSLPRELVPSGRSDLWRTGTRETQALLDRGAKLLESARTPAASAFDRGARLFESARKPAASALDRGARLLERQGVTIPGRKRSAFASSVLGSSAFASSALTSRGARSAYAGLLGVTLALGAMAVINASLARDAERRHKPRGRFITVDGVRLHYLEAGEGPTIVLLHGNGAMAEDWRLSGVFDLLAANHRVIAFDRPGFGWSERPRYRSWSAMRQGALLSEALVALGVRNPVLVGHSWGTLVAQAVALDERTQAASLVLLSGYYVPGFRTDVALLSPPAVPIVGDLLRWTVSPMLGRLLASRFYRRIFAPAPVTARFRYGFPLEMALRPWQVRATAADTAQMIANARTLRHRLRELGIPIVIVTGTGDRIVDAKGHAEQLHEEIPGSVLHRIEGAGHMVHHLAPEAVARAIETVARTTTPTPERGRFSPRRAA